MRGLGRQTTQQPVEANEGARLLVVARGVNAGAENVLQARTPTNHVGGTGQSKCRNNNPYAECAPPTGNRAHTHYLNDEVKKHDRCQYQRRNLKQPQSPQRREAIQQRQQRPCGEASSALSTSDGCARAGTQNTAGRRTSRPAEILQQGRSTRMRKTEEETMSVRYLVRPRPVFWTRSSVAGLIMPV